MKTLLNIKGNEYEVAIAAFRETDILHERRSTVTLMTNFAYSEVVELFTNPGEWSITEKFVPSTDANGNVTYQRPDRVRDCVEYTVLCSIRDKRDGLLEVVMGKITDSEALAELREVLNG